MYPAALIPKLLCWMRCHRREILHVCSGALPKGEGIRVDIRPEARPDIVADGCALPFADSSVAAVMIDPPYTPHYARELYGVKYPLPAHLLREAARVVRPGGRIAFVHYLVANPPDGAHHVKTFGLSMGFGYPMRAVTIYEKAQAGLFVQGGSPMKCRNCEEAEAMGGGAGDCCAPCARQLAGGKVLCRACRRWRARGRGKQPKPCKCQVRG